jgi:hypothetical protein
MTYFPLVVSADVVRVPARAQTSRLYDRIRRNCKWSTQQENGSAGVAQFAHLLLQQVPRTPDVRFGRMQISNRETESVAIVQTGMGDEDLTGRVDGLEDPFVQEIRIRYVST